MRRSATVLLLLALLASFGTGASAATTGQAGVVSLSGVTPLRLFASTERDVLRLAGRPGRRATVKTQQGETYRTLGYGCVSGRPCVTEYQIDPRSGTLYAFRTRSRRYRSVHGVRVGMTRQQANAREPRFHFVICGDLRLRTRTATVDFALSRDGKSVSAITLYAGELSSVYDVCY